MNNTNDIIKVNQDFLKYINIEGTYEYNPVYKGYSKQVEIDEIYDHPVAILLHTNPGWKVNFNQDGEFIGFSKKSKEEFNLIERVILQ